MKRCWRKIFAIGAMLTIALACGSFAKAVEAAEKKDDKAVLDEVLDILKV